jgi:hypothetical protein
MLAERARLNLAIVLLSAATLATTAFVLRPRCERSVARPSVAGVAPPFAAAAATPVGGGEDLCPPHVRAAMHLGADAKLSCVRGQFPEPGTFVFAQYRTTETWERFAVVADDGHLIVPMLDRPRR